MNAATDQGDVLALELVSDPRLLPGVREKLQQWVLPRGWTAEQAAEIALAVDEALSNVIRHGYAGEKTHRVCVQVRSIRDRRAGPGLEICIRDFGRQVDPGEIHGRDLDDVRPGGLGVHLIRAMVNSVEYSRAAGGGMQLILRKYQGHSIRGGPGEARKHERSTRRTQDPNRQCG